MNGDLKPVNGPGEDLGNRGRLAERMRQGPWLRILLWTALLSGVAWVILDALVQIRVATSTFSSQGEFNVLRWVEVVSGISHSLFVVAVGSYVVLWLATRPQIPSDI